MNWKIEWNWIENKKKMKWFRLRCSDSIVHSSHSACLSSYGERFLILISLRFDFFSFFFFFHFAKWATTKTTTAAKNRILFCVFHKLTKYFISANSEIRTKRKEWERKERKTRQNKQCENVRQMANNIRESCRCNCMCRVMNN